MSWRSGVVPLDTPADADVSYAYDANGERVLRAQTTTSATTNQKRSSASSETLYS